MAKEKKKNSGAQGKKLNCKPQLPQGELPFSPL